MHLNFYEFLFILHLRRELPPAFRGWKTGLVSLRLAETLEVVQGEITPIQIDPLRHHGKFLEKAAMLLGRDGTWVFAERDPDG